MVVRIGMMLLLLACAGCAGEETVATPPLSPTANGFLQVPGPNYGEPGAAGSYAQSPPGTIRPGAQ